MNKSRHAEGIAAPLLDDKLINSVTVVKGGRNKVKCKSFGCPHSCKLVGQRCLAPSGIPEPAKQSLLLRASGSVGSWAPSATLHAMVGQWRFMGLGLGGALLLSPGPLGRGCVV